MRGQGLGYCAPLQNKRGSHLPDGYGERQSFTRRVWRPPTMVCLLAHTCGEVSQSVCLPNRPLCMPLSVLLGTSSYEWIILCV